MHLRISGWQNVTIYVCMQIVTAAYLKTFSKLTHVTKFNAKTFKRYNSENIPYNDAHMNVGMLFLRIVTVIF